MYQVLGLWLACVSLKFTAAVKMMGGTDLGNVTFSEVVMIQKNGDKPETVCLGTVFNSFTVITSPFCEISNTTLADFSVIRATDILDPKPVRWNISSMANIGDSYNPPMFRPKALRLELPGFEFGWPSVSPAIFLDDDIKFDSFFEGNHQGIVVTNEDPHKAGAVMYNDSGSQLCNDSYLKVKDPSWPELIPYTLFCIYKGFEPINHTVEYTYLTIEPGTPCDDSLGSPVIIPYVGILGMLVKAFCGNEIVAFGMGSPSIITYESNSWEPPTNATTNDITSESVTQEPWTKRTSFPPGPTKRRNSGPKTNTYSCALCWNNLFLCLWLKMLSAGG